MQREITTDDEQPPPASDDRPVENVLRDGLEALMERYARARPGEPFGREHDLRTLFEDLRVALADSDAVRACPTVRVDWSAGMGGLARIPSVTFLDVRETRSARRGLACALVFRQDMSAVYLALELGTADLVERLGRAAARDALRAEAGRLRGKFADLAAHGFALDDDIDLGATTGPGADYRSATVAHKLYERGRVPTDAVIVDDLAVLLQTYTAHVASKTDAARVEPVTWIFQCNPKVYDLAGALAALPEVTWQVRQYADWIHAGDTVYLWESGPNAGVVAVATALTEPAEAPLDDAEAAFAIDREKLTAGRLRVRLRVDRVLPERLRRDDLKAHSSLATLSIFKTPHGTNFPVTPDEARALSALVAAEPQPAVVAPEETLAASRRGAARAAAPFEPERAARALVDAVTGRGFVFEPWQIAAYVAALRTKPFVILAGVSGTGKSRLPALTAAATGGVSRLIPVRPDWTDSSDVLGYTDLQGRFRPGPLLELAREAAERPDTHFVCVLDEMNLARVEHYFAEVLSRIEERSASPGGGFASGPLVVQRLAGADAAWQRYGLPPNLAVVGTVNMDESAHGFSRKVLDRAFTIELSDVDLSLVEPNRAGAVPASRWPVSAWFPRAAQLGDLGRLSDEEQGEVERAVGTLVEVNGILAQAQLQIGYRVRDEVALFVLNARDLAAVFATRSGDEVDPLDLALQMKILPRIAGGSAAIRRVALGLLGWASRGRPFAREEDAEPTVESWARAGRPAALPRARFPRTAARLCLMWERVLDEGFTSFWS